MDCVFCKIIRGEIPSFKIWEDPAHIAILDISPNTKGMTLVITKKHYDSYAFDMPTQDFLQFMQATQNVAKLLDKKLNSKRTALVLEGMGVNHVHAKLYPMHGVDEKKFGEHPDRKYFDKYPGYITTLIGPDADMEELGKLAKALRE